MSALSTRQQAYWDALPLLTEEDCARLDAIHGGYDGLPGAYPYGSRLAREVRVASRTSGEVQVSPAALLTATPEDRDLLQRAKLAPLGWYRLKPLCTLCYRLEEDCDRDPDACPPPRTPAQNGAHHGR